MMSVNVFSHLHIAVTALTAGVICFAIALWRIPPPRQFLWSIAIGLITAGAVYLWRASANVAALNQDGIGGLSANDWLAPVVVFVALSVFADLMPPIGDRRFAQVGALATVAVFAVNVIAI
jgi:hypothetical protein